MSLSDDKKLEAFLKENRPFHPRHSERDAEKIWMQISKDKSSFFWRSPLKAFGVLAAVAGLVAVINVTFQPMPESRIFDETALVEDSLDLEFLENGEIYEVTDLLSLTK